MSWKTISTQTLVRAGEQHLDLIEHLDVMKVNLEVAVEMVVGSTINANSTAHLILKATRILNGRS